MPLHRATTAREPKPPTPLTLVEIDTAEWGPKLKLTSPYHPSLPASLRSIGGRWSDATKAWYMPVETGEQVRQLCRQVYGTDPLDPTPPDLITIQWAFPDDMPEIRKDLWRFGRQLIYRSHPDQPVKTGKGVRIIKGGFDELSPPGRDPKVGYAQAGTVLEIRDVPSSLAETELRNKQSGVKIVKTAKSESHYAARVQIMELFRQLSPEEQEETLKALQEIAP